MKESCSHLSYCEPRDRKEKLKYYFFNQRSGVKICDRCGRVLVLSMTQALTLYISLNASSLIYWVLINYLPDQLMLQFIVPIVYIGFNWFIYSFVRAILRWHETPYTEESIPWHMKCLYKCILPLVYIATLLTVYLIIR